MRYDEQEPLAALWGAMSEHRGGNLKAGAQSVGHQLEGKVTALYG